MESNPSLSAVSAKQEPYPGLRGGPSEEAPNWPGLAWPGREWVA